MHLPPLIASVERLAVPSAGVPVAKGATPSGTDIRCTKDQRRCTEGTVDEWCCPLPQMCGPNGTCVN